MGWRASASIFLCGSLALAVGGSSPETGLVGDGLGLTRVVLSGAASPATPEDLELVLELGCGSCHGGLPSDDAIRAVSPPLGTAEVPQAPAFVFRYLADPQPIRPGIGRARMPAYDLNEGQRLALSLFVTHEIELRGVDQAFRDAQGRHPDVNRDTGGRLFRSLGCAGCHVHPQGGDPVEVGPDLSAEGARVQPSWLTDYLAGPVTIRPSGGRPGLGSQMPDFKLTGEERESIVRFLTDLGSEEAPDWEPTVLSPFTMAKAETLLTDRWSCLGCHQLGDVGGRVGPRLDGIAERLRPSFVREVMENPAHLMPGSIMPGSLEQSDRLDMMASFLIQRQGHWQPGARIAGLAGRELVVPVSSGEAMYQETCAACHGTEGRGDGFNAPFMPSVPTVHADSVAMALRPDDTLFDGIYAGGWILGKSNRMPAFGTSFTPEQIRALVGYIRKLCQCEAPLWSRDGRRG